MAGLLPPLNQTELFLSETGEPGLLRVDLDTETPCFDCFEIRRDQEGWRDLDSGPALWKLHEGLNLLRARVRNQAGVRGPESRAAVVWND